MKRIRVFALMMALVVAGLAWYFLKISDGKLPFGNQQTQQQTVDKSKQSVQVIIAREDIPAGMRIDETMLDQMTVQLSNAPSGYIKRVSDVLDKEATVSIMTGDTITNSMLVRDEPMQNPASSGGYKGDQLSEAIDAGYRAVVVSVDDYSGINGMLKPGDFVDIATSYKSGAQSMDAEGNVVEASTGGLKVIASNAKVLALDRILDSSAINNNQGYSLVTLMLTPDDALLVTYVQETSGVRLMLRNSTDEGTPVYDTVSDDTVMRK